MTELLMPVTDTAREEATQVGYKAPDWQHALVAELSGFEPSQLPQRHEPVVDKSVANSTGQINPKLLVK